jgi:hypothetical protein
MKIIINRILNLDGTWQSYKISSPNAYTKPTWKELGKQFNTLNDIIDFYKL